MKKKIIIIGKHSFIGFNLKKYFIKKKIKVIAVNYKNFNKNKALYLKNFNTIINCSSNLKFVKNKYSLKNDHDTNIAKLLKNTNHKLIMISTRKIYQAKYDIKENDKINPKCNYSKNKYKSELSLLKILKNRALILRTSNLIGMPVKNKKKLHKTFVDIFFENIKNGIIYENHKNFKDFLHISMFCKIVEKLINIDANGIYNLSLGKKVLLNELVKWLNYYNPKKPKINILKSSFNRDNFTLNNGKLLNKIKIKINLSELKKKCLELSKINFKYVK